MKNLDQLKGKKILVTGHTGFKGAWLSLWLNMLGADVVGVALDPKTDEDVFTLSGVGKSLKDYRADIRDLDRMKDIFAKEKPQVVFHLAAQPLVLTSYDDPVDTFSTNVMGTANVLEAIRHTSGVEVAIMVTSDKCYENKKWVHGYRETDPMGGHDPYSASKGAAEIVISSYRNSYFSKPGQTAIASVRAGNVIGGGDWSENRLVPDIIRAVQGGRQLEIRSPKAIRPWQHVLEPVGGYMLLASKMLQDPQRYADAWNFGPHATNIVTVGEIVDALFKHFDSLGWKDVSNPDQPHEASLLMLEINKAIYELGWKPVLDLKETAAMTAEWYMSYKTRDVGELSREQISKYVSLWKSRNEN
jgi:CDP-glucose 4,6-dehydratase